jgi:hypothetical protein
MTTAWRLATKIVVADDHGAVADHQIVVTDDHGVVAGHPIVVADDHAGASFVGRVLPRLLS